MGKKGKKGKKNKKDKKDKEVWADGGRLVVKKDLGFGQTLNLQGLLAPVLGAESGEVLIDLSGVRHLCSANLAVLASACSAVVPRGKKVRIVAAPAVAKVLRMGGIERLAYIEEIAEEQPGGEG